MLVQPFLVASHYGGVQALRKGWADAARPDVVTTTLVTLAIPCIAAITTNHTTTAISAIAGDTHSTHCLAPHL